MTTPTFPRFGSRPNPMYGLRYRSLCDRYEIYESDQLGGVTLDPVRWIAVRLDGPGEAGRVIGRHRCRQAAERRCVQDASRWEPSRMSRAVRKILCPDRCDVTSCSPVFGIQRRRRFGWNR